MVLDTFIEDLQGAAEQMNLEITPSNNITKIPPMMQLKTVKMRSLRLPNEPSEMLRRQSNQTGTAFPGELRS